MSKVTISEHAAALARRRAESLSPERRREIGRLAARARWARQKGGNGKMSGSSLADARANTAPVGAPP